MNKLNGRGRLSGAQRNRLNRLLNMLYTPLELAEEIGINRRQFYKVYIPAGLPHQRDNRKHILVNGHEFKAWYLAHYPKVRLEPGQAYCIICRSAVEMVEPVELEKDGLKYLVSHCPNCGRKLARIVSMKRLK